MYKSVQKLVQRKPMQRKPMDRRVQRWPNTFFTGLCLWCHV